MVKAAMSPAMNTKNFWDSVHFHIDENFVPNFKYHYTFGDFMTCLYAPNWFQSPVPSEAAVLDLSFSKSACSRKQSVLKKGRNDIKIV